MIRYINNLFYPLRVVTSSRNSGKLIQMKTQAEYFREPVGQLSANEGHSNRIVAFREMKLKNTKNCGNPVYSLNLLIKIGD
jgi:hypothetical protein